MSDSEKDRPENPNAGDSQARPGGGAVVISIEQARAELLARPRQHATPQMGVARRPRPRARDVPAPVTLPPGEHHAVIVADTPAARAHVDKRTVHPGEMPMQTHDKKVRVKTSLDPRRAKTQLSDRRMDLPPEPISGAGDPGSLWHPASVPPPAASASPSVPPPRLALARSKPAPRERSGVPMFLVGVILAAALGAGVVYLLGRTGGAQQATAPSTTAAVPALPATAAAIAQTVSKSAEPAPSAAAVEPAPVATAEEPATTAAVVPGTAPAVKSTAQVVKPAATAAPTSTPSATAKPTATNILPFGKEEP